MRGEILTPSSIWGKLGEIEVPRCTTIGEYKEGEIILKRLRLEGKQTEDGQVFIYAVLATSQKQEKSPAVIIFQKFTDGADETLATSLAKQGLTAFVVNVGGDDGINTNFTLYPPSLGYADYKNAKNNLSTTLEGDVTKTCWFQWGITAKTALKYLASLDNVDKIAGLGVEDGATVLWHLTATEKFDCLCFVQNTGWEAYKDNFKFLAKVDEQFADDKLNYLAGIEPQAYAGMVKTPTFIACSTNYARFDFDRAHDTFSRISDKVGKVINYTVGGINGIDKQVYSNLVAFLKNNLLNKKVINLPESPTLKCEIEDKRFVVEVFPDKENVKKVRVFVAEELYNPTLRQWQEISVEKQQDSYVANYLPYNQSGAVFFFAMVEYKNGLITCSNVLSRKFAKEEVLLSHKSKIIYSSREQFAKSSFYPAECTSKKPTGMDLSSSHLVVEKQGAMGITGVTCKSGLVTFKVGMNKFRPQEDGILLLDAYIKHGGKITVKLIADYFGLKREFIATAMVSGGEVWHNLKFAINNFKTEEGMSIRSIEKIQALEVNADSDYLVNNLLWV